MIRRVQLNINYANTNKKETLDRLCKESNRVINLFIDSLWEQKDFNSKFIKEKVDTWLSARMQQCLGKQALEIVKSQRKRKKKTKPIFNRFSFNLDSRFVQIALDVNSFDIWVALSSIGERIKLRLPSKKHKHFNKFVGWTLRKSCRLRMVGDIFYIDVYMEKDAPIKKSVGRTIGLDIGYKKLIATSDNKFYGKSLEDIYQKISRKKQGSKAFKRALVERTNKTNRAINQLPFNQLKAIIVEDLKGLKHKTKGFCIVLKCFEFSLSINEF